MNNETLIKARRLDKKINEYKDAIEFLKNNWAETHYTCQGWFNSSERYLIDLDEEAKSVLINHYELKVKELESELEKL